VTSQHCRVEDALAKASRQVRSAEGDRIIRPGFRVGVMSRFPRKPSSPPPTSMLQVIVEEGDYASSRVPR